MVLMWSQRHSQPKRRRPPEAASRAEIEQAIRLLRDVVRRQVPDALSGASARQFVTLFSEAERVAASGVALFAPRVVESGEYTKGGHGTAAEWLGALSGSSAGAAKGRLAAAARAAKDPLLTEALHDGELSVSELGLVTKTLSETPEASADLLDLMNRGASHQELSDAATQMRGQRPQYGERATAAGPGPHQPPLSLGPRRTRGYQGRVLLRRGGVRPGGTPPRSRGQAALEGRRERGGSGDGGGDSLEAHRLDAFIDLLSGSGAFGPGDDDEGDDDHGGAGEGGRGGPRGHRGRSGPGPGPRPRTLIIVNAESLRRGTTEGDELCEIEGIGPVSVAAAKELLSQGGFQYLVKEGFDIKTVTRSTRVVANCIDMALVVRDRVCARPGCGNRLGLERDHRQVDYGNDGPTELDNLVRLCPSCHRLKTDGGWRLEGRPGAWKWVAPAKPPTAPQMARVRKVAVAKGKAKAFVKKDPSGPRRT